MSDWMGDGVDGWYPLDCYDYKSTCGAKEGRNEVTKKRTIVSFKNAQKENS